MSAYLYFTLFLFLVCSIFCALPSYADNEESDPTTEKSVEIFKKECEIKNEQGGGAASQNKIQNVDNVYFVTAGDWLVAVAETNYTTGGQQEKTIDFVSASVEIKTDWDKKIFLKNNQNCEGWERQKVTKNPEKTQIFSTAKNVVYDKNNKKIFLLVVNKTSTSQQWEYNLFVGAVSKSGDSTLLAWTKTTSLKFLGNSDKKNEFENKLKEDFIGSSSTDGGAFVTNDGRIVFLLKAANKDKSKNVFALVELKYVDSKTDQELGFLHVEETNNKCYPHFFWGGEKIVMITTGCEGGAGQKVKESTDMTIWEKDSGPFYYLYDFLKDKTSFTTAVINNKIVLLFAKQTEKTECTNKENKCFTFWFSDGNRTYNVGKNVALDEKINVASSSFVYAKEKLFFLYQHLEDTGTDKKFILTPLKEQLQKIKTTLEKWKEADDAVLKLCQAGNSDFGAICSAPLPAEGLVGFLSNENDSTNKWKDDYLYKNADITGNAKVENGLKCNGAKDGAKWLVNEGDEKQLYEFSKNGFTLLAMVTIDGNIAEGKSNSLLGLVLKGESKPVGFLCSNESKWSLRTKEKTENLKKNEEGCEKGKTYSIAFILKKDNNLDIYVDGKQLEVLDNNAIKINEEKSITHFYFGAADDKTGPEVDESHVTIKNVLLYNRAFNKDEITNLKKKKIHTSENNKEPNNKDKNTNTLQPKENIADNSDQQTSTQLPTDTIGDKKEEKEPSPSRTEDGGAGGSVRVFSLLLALLCVSAPLLHL